MISNNIVILIKLVELGDGEAAGHQGRTQSDPHQPQVSVPLISRPVVSYRKGGTTPLRGVRLGGGGVFRCLLFFVSCYHVTRLLGVLFSITCSVGVHVMGRACSSLLFVVCRSES